MFYHSKVQTDACRFGVYGLLCTRNQHSGQTLLLRSVSHMFPARGNSSLSQAGSSGLTCLSLTNYAHELRNNSSSSCVLMSIYCVSTAASALPSPLQSRPHSTRAVLQMRLEIRGRFFCGRMVLSRAPDSCAGLLFALS